MIRVLLVILITAMIFVAVIISSAKGQQSRVKVKFTGKAAVIAGIGGLIIYGYSYAVIHNNILLAISFALISTLKMFMGSDNYSAISNVELFNRSYMILVFWVVHLTAVYATASAVMATIGAPALKQIRVLLCKRSNTLNIIYGINKDSVQLAGELSKEKDSALVMIDANIDSGLIDALNEYGCLYFSNEEAIMSYPSFLKKIGVKNGKKICIYCLYLNEARNLEYIHRLKAALESFGVDYTNTSLTMLANMEMAYGSDYQATRDKYGFGSVLVYDRAYLTAHTLVREYPPCDFVDFDTEKAKARDGELFHAVIVGFGKIGQAVLKNLVINGQFEGCDFKATVFDPQHEDVSGYFYKNSGSIMKEYDIELKAGNAKESTFYNYIEDNVDSLDYIVVCTGDDIENSEIVGEVQSTLRRMNGHAKVFQCSYNMIIHQRYSEDGQYKLHVTNLYTKDNMSISHIDSKAMELNHIYCRGESAIEDWRNASFINRMSSRASADFAPAFLRMTGFKTEDVVDGDKWDKLSNEQILNLSKTEHLRWCAFFYSLGYRLMPEEILKDRCDEYIREVEASGSSSIKIQKDDRNYLQACLVGWDELDDLTRLYRQVTGDMQKDFKEDDTHNVMLLPKIIMK